MAKVAAFVATLVMSAAVVPPAVGAQDIKSQCRKEATMQGMDSIGVSVYTKACVEKRGAHPSVDTSTYGPPRAAVETELTLIRDDLQLTLKDAESARFNNVRIRDSKDGTSVFCGFVNSKNSYGAYSGFQPIQGSIVVIDAKKIPVAVMVDATLARVLCMQYDMALP